MAWFRRSAMTQDVAVVTPLVEGAAALRLKHGSGKPVVSAFSQREGMASLMAALTELTYDIDARTIPLIALLGQEHYQTVMVESPTVPEEELLGALRWKVKDLVNFSIDDAVVDFMQVPERSGRAPFLYVVAAQGNAIRELAKPYQEADLHLDVIDVLESAQHNLAMKLAAPEYAVAVLHLGGSSGLLTFSFADGLVLSRRIEGRNTSGDVLFEKVAMEVQRSMDYFERQYSWFPLSKLFVAPMPAAQAMQAKLREYVSIGVDIADLSQLFDLTAVPQLQEPRLQNLAFHMLGAALREAR